MRSHNTKRNHGIARLVRNRHTTGQGLIEGVCGTWVLITTFVFLTMFGLNVYATMMAHEKLRLVATEAARVMDEKQHWLGMKRPNADSDAARAEAEALAKALCTKLGLPEPRTVTYAVETAADDRSISFTSCTVNCQAFKLPYGLNHVFPSVLDISETGVAGSMIVEPYALLNLEVPLAGTSLAGAQMGGNAAILLPIYGTTFGPVTTNPGYRDPLNGGITVGELKGPFDAVRLTLLNQLNQVTSCLNAEVAHYGPGMPPSQPTTTSIAPVGTSTASSPEAAAAEAAGAGASAS